MRIVSLLASGTEIVCALGAGESLVGRSHECDNPEWVRSLPACNEPAFDVSVSSSEIDREVNRRIRGGEPLYTIHTDRIRDLAPDVIITQEHCNVCAVTPGDLDHSGWRLGNTRVVSLHASSVCEIFDSILQIAQALDLEECGEALVQAERGKLDRIREQTSALRHPSVVVLEWTDPIFSMGNWAPELVEIAGGNPLLATPGQHSHPVPAEQLLHADPEVLVVAPCGFNLERSMREQEVLERLPWWRDLTAVRTGRVAFADGNFYFNRSGMSITATAEILAEIFHGTVFKTETTSLTKEIAWRWYTEARVSVV